jgi:tetratricopeptide (TPR) repeat protein
MRQAILRFALLAASLLIPLLNASTRAAGKDVWVEVRSPNFTVISNAGEKEARKVADQFEQFREVFHNSFPKLRVDLGKPLIIFAAKNKDSLKLLLPGYWEVKGRVHPAGIYVPGEERHFVALRTNYEGENPYQVIYHEYTHAILNLNFRGLPVWLGEGLAEFFGNSSIHDNYVNVGQIAPYHLQILHDGHLIPIDALLEADTHSPYYNEENRASVFYAESWAIVHYLMMDPEARKRQLLSNFLNVWDAGGNQVEAAQKSFGDLKEFSQGMERYSRQQVFYIGKVNTTIRGDPKSYSSRVVPVAELAADRALFYVHTRRSAEARASAEEALKADPNLPLAHDAQGLLVYSEGDFETAEAAFTRAMELHSTSYFAYFFSAQARLRRGEHESDDLSDIATTLQKAIAMNPQFAPAYAALASVYSMNKDTWEKAIGPARKAIELEPGNLNYNINFAYMLLNVGKTSDAKALAVRIRQAIKTPGEKTEMETLLQAIASHEAYEKAVAEAAERAKLAPPEVTTSNRERTETVDRQDTTEVPGSAVSKKHAGEDEFASQGIIQTADCGAGSRGTIVVRSGNSTLKLFYSDVSSLYVLSTAKEDSGVTPACGAWKGRRARLYFYKTKEQFYAGELDTIQFY